MDANSRELKTGILGARQDGDFTSGTDENEGAI
jgi:hypothetical protein